MYIVIELQVSGENISTQVFAYASRLEAESTYHSILAAAAISTVPTHGATMLTAEGKEIMHQSYNHEHD